MTEKDFKKLDINFAFRSLTQDDFARVHLLIDQHDLTFFKIQQRKYKGLMTIGALSDLLESQKDQIMGLLLFQ